MVDIIFISFEFPPILFGGVFRSLKFTKYLPEFGIRPHVYTLDPDYYDRVYRGDKTDVTLLDELKGKDVVLNRVPMDSVLDMYKSRVKKFLRVYFNIYRGNEFRMWEKYLLSKVYEDAKKHDFKAVLVTAPPFGMLRNAKKIAAQLNIPMIMDMRDAWSLWNTVPYGSIFHYWFTKRAEKEYLQFAYKVIATSEQTYIDWQQLYPSLPDEKFACITNGYDDEQGARAFAPFRVEALNGERVFTIAYVGSFYYSPEIREEMRKPFYKKPGMEMLHYFPRRQDWLYRTPYFFFKSLQTLFKKQPALKSRIRIRFAGRKEPWLMEMIRDFDLVSNVEHLGFVSHAVSLQIQSEADALLLTSAKLEGGKDCFIAGKTFEYLTMGKPILAYTAEGAQKDLLKGTGLALFLDPDQPNEAATILLGLLQQGKTFTPDVNYLRSFERKKLTSKLAEIINSTINA